MEDPFASIEQAVAEVRGAWLDALDAKDAAALTGGPRAQVDAMSDAGVVAVNEKLAAARRQLDALHAPVAAAIAERSAASRGAQGLARKHGHRTPVKLIAAATGGHSGDAARLIQVGEATAGRMTFTGERTEARRPHIAAALGSGSLSVAAAAAIAALLDKLALRVDPVTLEEAERTIVGQAAILSLDELNAVLRRAEGVLDPDGLEPKLDQLRADRSLIIREDRTGMVLITVKLDPENAAPVKTVIEALVTHQLRTSRGRNAVGRAGEGAGADAVGPAVPETRSVPQMQADALVTICRHVLGCDATDLPLATTTILVRMPLDAVTTGVGVATIEGIAQPIGAGTARRMAANASIIPCVLGGDSEVLDLGRAKRFFTPVQRLALIERDGGCASCGLPPGMVEGHHIRWWDLHQGPTDLANGILLCTACHHRIHDDGWEIRIDPPASGDVTGGTVWFIPPPHVDPAQRPRLGGRKRFDYTHKIDFGRAA